MSTPAKSELQPWEKLKIVANAPGVNFYATNRIELGLVHDRFLTTLQASGATAAELRDMSDMASRRAVVHADQRRLYISQTDRDIAGARLVLSTLHSVRDFAENAFHSQSSLNTLESRLESLPKEILLAEALEIDPQNPRASSELSLVLPFARYLALRGVATGNSSAVKRGNNVLQAIENRSESAGLRPGANKRVEDRYTTHKPLHKIVVREVGRMVSSYTVAETVDLLPEVTGDQYHRGVFHFAVLTQASKTPGSIGEIASQVIGV